MPASKSHQDFIVTPNSDLGVAIDAAVAGAAVASTHLLQLDALDVRCKTDGSPVTYADLAVDRLEDDYLAYRKRTKPMLPRIW